MPLGSLVEIEGPSSDLTLHTDVKRTAVFLAGGIGITPFPNMAFHSAQEKLPRRWFFSAQTAGRRMRRFLTSCGLRKKGIRNSRRSQACRNWRNRAGPGPVDKEMLAKYLRDALSPIYYVAGPPGMV
jgi:ferredoxin-NADP reductase